MGGIDINIRIFVSLCSIKGVRKMDIKRLKRIAGLLTESYDDDDDDMSPAERELAAKADQDLKKRGVDVDKEHAAAEKKQEAAKAEPKAEEKAEEKKEEKAEEKKVEAVAKKRGKPVNPDSKQGKMRAWLSSNTGATRGAFMKHAAEVGMSPAHANTLFYAIKKGVKKVEEAYVFRHPMAPKFVLAENDFFNRYEWVDPATTGSQIVVVEGYSKALELVDFLSTVKNMHVDVEPMDLGDDE